MKELTYTFSDKRVKNYLNGSFSRIADLVQKEKCIVITDDVVFGLYADLLEGFKTIIIPAGEQHKQQDTIEVIVRQLIGYQADRKSFIVGIGGGVVTDMAGYIASIYMRGVSFGFVPTTVLAQVDASIGGKNGIDVGVYKNLIGTIRQPEFILFDHSLLQSLPEEQWVNGFAEIIKHACIKDAGLFTLLERSTLSNFKNDQQLLADLIERNVAIKSKVVEQDEWEQGDRKLLNFGHTIGHAIENEYNLLHGHAISIGMAAAATISEKLNGFSEEEKQRVVSLLQRYHLPVKMDFDKRKVFDNIMMDKKRVSNEINFVLLNTIGKAMVKSIPLPQLEQIIQEL